MRIIRILSLLFLSALALQAQQPESYSSYYDLFFLRTFARDKERAGSATPETLKTSTWLVIAESGRIITTI